MSDQVVGAKVVTSVTDAEGQDVPGAQALLRGIDLLLAIGTAAQSPSFRDLEKAVNIPRASLHRILAALASRNLVRYDERNKTYEVGMRILDLSRRTLDKSGIIRAAKPEVARLTRRLQRTVCLVVLDGDDVFVLDFEDFDSALGRLVRTWPRDKALKTAGGHAMLAAMPREKAELMLNLNSGAPDDDPGDLDAFLSSLSIIKALGYAVLMREPGSGLASVAAPIFDETGYPIAALTCYFDVGQATSEDLHETGRILAEAARRASGHLRIGFPTPSIEPRPALQVSDGVEILPTGRDFVGENPVWNAEVGRLYWLDVLGPSLRWWDPAARTTGRIQLPSIVVGLVFDAQGRMIACGEHGLSVLDPETGAMHALVHPEANRRDNRFNTATVDARGRIWSATVAINHEVGKGSLYSFDPDLTVRQHIERLGAPRTVAFNVANTRLYLIDSSDYAIYAFDYDLETGRIAKRALFLQGDVASQPSGITVDAYDHPWITFLGGWCVRRYRPDGSVAEEYALPFPMPTHCTFGGAEMSTLFVTSTWLRLPPGFAALAPASGELVAIHTQVKGQIPNRAGQLPLNRFRY